MRRDVYCNPASRLWWMCVTLAATVYLSGAIALAQPADFVTSDANRSYVLDSETSWIRVLVFRAGLLGGLGHNHVVSHHQIDGEINELADSAEGGEIQISLHLRVEDFVVDDPDLRAVEGDEFPGAIKDKDRVGTRKNMLGARLLSAGSFPEIVVDTRLPANGREMLKSEEFLVDSTISIKGGSYLVQVPLRLAWAEDSFMATGDFLVDHADLGLKPFQAALGALKVHETMRIKFEFRGVATSGAVELLK